MTYVKSGPLTPRQREIYDFLRQYAANYGTSPTLLEVGKQFAINASTVSEHLNTLELTGSANRNRHLVRGTTVLGACPYCGAGVS